MNNTMTEKNPAEIRLLRRAGEGAMLGGVAAGLAAYFDLDVTLVRIAIFALSFLGGAGVPLYVAAWLLIPEEGSDVAIAADILNHARYR
ncbi:MAG: PspC domain-containing protein [Acidimicrobiales bacterium]